MLSEMAQSNSLKIKFVFKLISLAESPLKKFKSRSTMLKIFLIRKLRERGREDLERTGPEKIGLEDQENTMKTDPEEIEIMKTGHQEEIVRTDPQEERMRIDLPEEIVKIDPQEEIMKTDLREEIMRTDPQEETDKIMKDLPEEISRIETGKKEDLLSAGLKSVQLSLEMKT